MESTAAQLPPNVSAVAAHAAAVAAGVPDTAPPASVLFDAVVRSDHDRLVRLFASNAHASVRSYVSMRQRWALACPNKALDPYMSEEKNDDFVQQIPFRGAAAAPASSAFSSSSLATMTPRADPSGSTSPRISPGTTARQNEDAAYAYLQHELALLMASTPTPSSTHTSTSTSTHEDKSPSAAGNANLLGFQMPPTSEEADRLVWEASAHLSDSRPPADFLVYKKDGSYVVETNSFANGNLDLIAASTSPNNQHQQPPVFDGSVANATPPPPGGGVGGASGGAGTVLHLACAMDLPLVLAFCLAMGADARATHTAFRRMMIHEAACNGSIKCLTLLLELGQECARHHQQEEEKNAHLLQPDIYDEKTAWRLPSPRRNLAQQTLYPDDCMGRIGDSTGQRQLPLFPTSINDRSVPIVSPSNSSRSSASSPSSSPPPPPPSSSSSSSSSERQRPAIGMNLRHFRRSRQLRRQMNWASSQRFVEPPRDEESNRVTIRKKDLLGTLKQFRALSSLVRDGLVSDLDAARTLMKDATMSSSSRMALIRSASFDAPSPYDPSDLSRVLLRSNGCADGHGNTPLHWAAFKNEVACVSMLLEFRADPNARAHPSGWTPLHDAAYSNSTESIGLLIDHGAHVDARANSGATPLCFAAQEDAASAAQLLLKRGADLTARCAAPNRINTNPSMHPGHPQSRFSGYTPLHYCAHYNAHGAARVLLHDKAAPEAMETPDLSERLPIHIAVARGSSDVLRELLHAGARIDTRPNDMLPRVGAAGVLPSSLLPGALVAVPRSPSRRPPTPERPRTPARESHSNSSSPVANGSSTPVSSPLLRSMIPTQPVVSSKPWNCLSQKAIDECRELIHKAEQSWSPDRHLLFTPFDRRAVMELLRVGKRLEQQGTGIFIDLWPLVLSFCGRGWFDVASPAIEADGSTSNGKQGDEGRDELMLPALLN